MPVVAPECKQQNTKEKSLQEKKIFIRTSRSTNSKEEVLNLIRVEHQLELVKRVLIPS